MTLWRQARNRDYTGVYVTNFNIFYRDWLGIQAVQWAAVIDDEYQKTMRRYKSETFKRFITVTRHIPIVIPTSGSLFRKDASSMFTVFKMVRPDIFTSYWKFVKRYAFVDDTGDMGKMVYGVRRVEELKELIDKYLAYVPRSVVADQLPEGRRMGTDVEMTPEQDRIYTELYEELLSITGNRVILSKTEMGKVLVLRQLLCCPRILDPSLGMGAGYESILDSLEEEPHCVIFVPFRPACEYIHRELTLKGFNAFILYGGIGHEEQTKRIKEFEECRGIIVCTIQYAESFDLVTCKTSHFLGYEYSLDINEQAEGRTQRAISPHDFVTWKYIRYANSLDEHYLEDLNQQSRDARKIMDRPEELIKALRRR